MAAILIALTPVSIQAQVPHHILSFVEHSDTLLTATFDGNPVGIVNNISPDHWEWRSGFFTNVTDQTNVKSTLWEEPSGETGVNFLDVHFFETDIHGMRNLGLEITSELQGFDTEPKNVNGGFGFSFTGALIGGAAGYSTTDVYFSDLGDSTVPDGSSTLGLLLISTAAMFGASRPRTEPRS